MNRTAIAALLVPGLLLPLAAPARAGSPTPALEMPWREAGWSEREAAALLLDRLAFGARPGDVDAVVRMGLDIWVERQLAASLQEPALAARLDRLPALGLSTAEIAATYPPGFALRNMAIEAGIVDREAFEAAATGSAAAPPRARRAAGSPSGCAAKGIARSASSWRRATRRSWYARSTRRTSSPRCSRTSGSTTSTSRSPIRRCASTC